MAPRTPLHLAVLLFSCFYVRQRTGTCRTHNYTIIKHTDTKCGLSNTRTSALYLTYLPLKTNLNQSSALQYLSLGRWEITFYFLLPQSPHNRWDVCSSIMTQVSLCHNALQSHQTGKCTLQRAQTQEVDISVPGIPALCSLCRDKQGYPTLTPITKAQYLHDINVLHYMNTHPTELCATLSHLPPESDRLWKLSTTQLAWADAQINRAINLTTVWSCAWVCSGYYIVGTEICLLSQKLDPLNHCAW